LVVALGVILFELLCGELPFTPEVRTHATCERGGARTHTTCERGGAVAACVPPGRLCAWHLKRAPLRAVGAQTHEDIDVFGKTILYYFGELYLAFPPVFDQNAKNLVTLQLAPEAADRVGPATAMKHPFYSGMDFMALEKGQLRPPMVPSVTGAADTTHFDEYDEEDEYDAPSGGAGDAVDCTLFPSFVEIPGWPPKGGFAAVSKQPTAVAAEPRAPPDTRQDSYGSKTAAEPLEAKRSSACVVL
jgi:serine/threonine protein kinase